MNEIQKIEQDIETLESAIKKAEIFKEDVFDVVSMVGGYNILTALSDFDHNARLRLKELRLKHYERA